MTNQQLDPLVEDYLIHHGVKGMKWGVRKDDRTSSRRTARNQKKAEKRNEKLERYKTSVAFLDTKISELNSEIKMLEKSSRFNLLKRQKLKNAKRTAKSLEKVKKSQLKDAERVANGKLTSNQRLLIAGAVITTAYVSYKVAESGEVSRLITNGRMLLNGGERFTKNPLNAGKMSPDSAFNLLVPKINPDYGSPGTTNNCRRCTFAYEMMRRGNEVSATKTLTGATQTALGFYNATNRDKNFKFTSSPSLSSIQAELLGGTDRILKKSPYIKALYGTNEIEKSTSLFSTLSKMPNGARGEFQMTWKAGGGHSMAWEIFDGKPVIFDTQTRKMYKKPEAIAKLTAMMESGSIARLDNVKLNEQFLSKWVKNA